MTFTDAAAEVLRLVGRPLHYKEITDIAIEKNLLSHVGKSPEVTMGARLAATLKKESDDNPLIRVKPGVFALRIWDDKTIKGGLEPKRGKKSSRNDQAPGPVAEEGAAPEAAHHEESAETAASEETAEEVVETAPIAGRDHEDEGAEDDDEVLVGIGPSAEPSVPHASHASHGSHVSPAPAAQAPASAGEHADATHGSHAHGTPVAPASPASPASPPRRIRVEDDELAGPDDVMRAEAAAGAAEMFDEEEDDDQPILGGADDRTLSGGEIGGDGRRRRRRRRRGGRTNGDAPAATGSAGTGGLPTYTATPAFEGRRDNGTPSSDRGSSVGREPREAREPREPREMREPREGVEAFRPQVIELTSGDGHALDDLSGRELSDAIAAILTTFDRNAGAVSLRAIAETAQRRGRLAGDVQLVQSQVAAAVRADNARRVAQGSRPRFRLAGGRVALTDWLLSGDLARLEQEALAAVERYREAARRAFARKLGELPGHAFVEICVLALEKMGVSQIRALRRAGTPGGESHFTGIVRTAVTDELRVAIIIRRDGREVGRERVADLRGSLHHYASATAGWVFTAGQMLSGAREEAAVLGVAPIALFDGLAVARLCEDSDVAVIRAKLPIAIPDVDLLEALRAS